MNPKEKKKRRYISGRYIFAGIVCCTYILLEILLLTGNIPNAFPDDVINMFQKIAFVCAILVLISFILYGVLYTHYDNEKKKYERIIENIGKDYISNSGKNPEKFSINNESKNEAYAKKYQEYEKKAKKVIYVAKAIFSILLAVTVISIDIPIILWFTIFFIAIILAIDSVYSYYSEFCKTYTKENDKK